MTETIQNALRRLRDDATGKRAPDTLEVKLLASYRAHHASRKRRRILIPVAMAASLLIVAWSLSQPSPKMTRSTYRAVAKAPSGPAASVATHVGPSQEMPRIVKNDGAIKPKPRVRTLPTRRIAQAPPPQQLPPSQQSIDEFVQIPYTPALAEYESGRVVRVNMPGASVRSLGLPVMSDRIQADLFVGDDGIARAIRVVSNVGLNSSGLNSSGLNSIR